MSRHTSWPDEGRFVLWPGSAAQTEFVDSALSSLTAISNFDVGFRLLVHEV